MVKKMETFLFVTSCSGVSHQFLIDSYFEFGIKIKDYLNSITCRKCDLKKLPLMSNLRLKLKNNFTVWQRKKLAQNKIKGINYYVTRVFKVPDETLRHTR